MFKKLLESLESVAYKAAAAKGMLACPNCGAKPATIPPQADDAITCGGCGTAASALEWTAAASGRPLADPDQPPADTKITRTLDAAGASVWSIPASGKSGGLMFFGIFWCSITAILSSVFLFGGSKIKSEDGFPVVWLLVAFFGLFWAIGLGMLYAACRSKYAKHRLSADASHITLRRELFGRFKSTALPADSITSIDEVVFYQKNYQPVRGIEIRGRVGKLRFGSQLTEEEKPWLVADMRRVILHSSTPPVVSAIIADSQVPAHSTGMRQDFFSIVLPRAASNLMPLAIMALLMGIGFACIGIFFLDDKIAPAAKSDPTAMRVIESIFTFMGQGFRVIWTLMSVVMAAAGLALLVRLKRTAGQETRIEGTGSEIAIRTSRHGRVLTERMFPRPSVADIRCSLTGSSNGKTMKRVELIAAGKSVPISRWVEAGKADVFVEEVRRVML